MGVGILAHGTRAPTEGFFHPDLFFSRPVCLGYYEKSHDICEFWGDKLISNISAFNNIKLALHYSVHMRTSGEKIRILDEAEHVQSVSYSHKMIVRLTYSGAFRGRQARHLPRTPLCNCNVQSSLSCCQMGHNSNCNV